MGVPAPYQNSALVPNVELVEASTCPEMQPLSREEEELLMDNLDMCTMTSGACWYVTAEVEATPVEFLIDPGAMVTALSIETFNYLCSVRSSNLTLVPLARSVRAANTTRMEVFGFWLLHISIRYSKYNHYCISCCL